MRVATYSRVSTSHHEQNPEIQALELKRFCESRGWVIVEEIKDFASGGTTKREGLQKLFKMIEDNKIDCIVVTKLDRLFRSLRQLVTTLDDFHSKGISFVAIKDAVDYTTPSGKLFTQILGSLSEFEKSLIRERTMAGLEYAKTIKGKKLGRPKERRNTELILHLQKQGMSQRAISKITGYSLSTVCRELNLVSKMTAT
jgi:DNA invertase Pin-like site-specific DNA recombinase